MTTFLLKHLVLWGCDLGLVWLLLRALLPGLPLRLAPGSSLRATLLDGWSWRTLGRAAIVTIGLVSLLWDGPGAKLHHLDP